MDGYGSWDGLTLRLSGMVGLILRLSGMVGFTLERPLVMEAGLDLPWCCQGWLDLSWGYQGWLDLPWGYQVLSWKLVGLTLRLSGMVVEAGLDLLWGYHGWLQRLGCTYPEVIRDGCRGWVGLTLRLSGMVVEAGLDLLWGYHGWLQRLGCTYPEVIRDGCRGWVGLTLGLSGMVAEAGLDLPWGYHLSGMFAEAGLDLPWGYQVWLQRLGWTYPEVIRDGCRSWVGLTLRLSGMVAEAGLHVFIVIKQPKFALAWTRCPLNITSPIRLWRYLVHDGSNSLKSRFGRRCRITCSVQKLHLYKSSFNIIIYFSQLNGSVMAVFIHLFC